MLIGIKAINLIIKNRLAYYFLHGETVSDEWWPRIIPIGFSMA